MTDSDKKKGMVMVISVGGKPPKSPEDTSKPDVKKALPHQQAFRVFPKRGGSQHFGGSEHSSTNPEFIHSAPDIGSMDVPDKQEHERLGTVHPSITAMLERLSSSTPYSSIGGRGKHSFPLSDRSISGDTGGIWDRRMSHQVDDIEGLTEPHPKTTHGYQSHFLESVPDTRHYSPTSGGTGPMHRRQDEAEQRNRDISAHDDNEDLEWSWGKNQDMSDAGWKSRRKLTPEGQEIVTQGSLFGEPDAPDLDYDYEPDYSELSHDEIYGEEPVGVRDDRFDLGLYNEKTGKFSLEDQKNAGEPMEIAFQMLKAPIPEATAGMGKKPQEGGGLPFFSGPTLPMFGIGVTEPEREEFDASKEGRALAEGPQGKQDFRQLDRHGDEIKPGPVTGAQQEQHLQRQRRAEGNLDQMNTDEISDTHSNPVLPHIMGVDPPMPEVGEGDSMTMPPPRRVPPDDSHRDKEFWSPAADEQGGGAFLSPESLRRLKAGLGPKPIMTSFDGPLNHAWALLKFVNKDKYRNMVPNDPDSQPTPPSDDSSLQSLIELLSEMGDGGFGAPGPTMPEEENERSPARGLSNLQDPFRMKRPEMESEMDDMGAEETRRFSPEVLGERWPAKDWHGQEEDEGEMPQFSMDKPEMNERRQALQSEIARRGKPALDE